MNETRMSKEDMKKFLLALVKGLNDAIRDERRKWKYLGRIEYGALEAYMSEKVELLRSEYVDVYKSTEKPNTYALVFVTKNKVNHERIVELDSETSVLLENVVSEIMLRKILYLEEKLREITGEKDD